MDDGGVVSATDQQTMVSSFLEIAVGQTADTARQFLQATSWKLEEAIQLFYVGNDGGLAAAASSPNVPPQENDLPNQITEHLENDAEPETVTEHDSNEVRAPLPVKRDVLYDTATLYGGARRGYNQREARTVDPFRNFDEELKRGVWEMGQGATSTADTSRDNLATLYRPPFALMFHGSFEKAKEAAKTKNQWLLVNLQSTREFSSHMLNRDTWANEAVAQTIISNFIFWQVCDDTEEGSKIKTYYKLDSVPVTLVIDPVTGQKMRLWRGMIQPESLLEDLLQFMDGSPNDHHFTLSHKRVRENSNSEAPPPAKIQVVADEETKLAKASSMESAIEDSIRETLKDSDAVNTEKEIQKSEKHIYPPLPEEPKGDRSLLCRVGVRLPDGRRLQRNFLRSDPIQLLWSFCYANLESSDEKRFRLTHAIPGAVKDLDFKSESTFDQSDPDADIVVAVSPTKLLDANKYLCEVCYKGFPRKQNLTLHRRAHNLPFALKTTKPKDPVPRKVYLCPKPSCVHHNRSYAIGDFGGLKKHYLRKHCSEKKYKCDTCSKAYSVQIDLRAQLNSSARKKYICGCGSRFARRYHFIVHKEACGTGELVGAAKDPQTIDMGDGSVNSTRYKNISIGSTMSHPSTLGMVDNTIRINSIGNINPFIGPLIPSIQNQFNSYPCTPPYQSQLCQFGADHNSLMTNPYMGLKLLEIRPSFSTILSY